ncbi:MAG TPA: TolC family protein [Polyangiales bacterium]|nr:TolC family protein [Polyangiales bacterium]
MKRLRAAVFALGLLGANAHAEDVRVPDASALEPARAGRNVHAWREAVALLARADPELAAATEASERAQAVADQALAGVLPRLQLSAAFEYRPLAPLLDLRSGQIENTWLSSSTWTPSTALEVSIPVFALQQWAHLRAAKRFADAAEAELRSTGHRVKTALAATLIATVTAERLGEVARDGVRAANSRLALAQSRKDLGAATALDVRRFEQDALSARASVIAAHEAIWRTREALAIAVGSRTSVGVSPELTVDQMVRDATAQCRPVPGVEERPEVAAAASSRRAATETVREARSAYWPTAAVTTRYELARTTASDGTQSSQRLTTQVWSVLGVLTWTLFDGGERAAVTRETEAAERHARARLSAARGHAAIATERSKKILESAEDARAVAEAALETARETDRLTRLEQQLGRGSAFEAVGAAASLRRSELELTLRQYALVQARFGAMLALADCH